MILCVVIIAASAMLLGIAAQTALPKEIMPPRGMRAFYRAAYFLMVVFQNVRKNEKRAKIGHFETERLARVLAVCFFGAAASLLIQAVLAGQSVLNNGYEIERPKEGQGEYAQELHAQIGDEKQTEELEVVITGRHYTEEEKETFLTQAIQQLDTEILGENESPDEVRGRVILPVKMLEDKVSVQWIQEPADLLDENGCINEDVPEEGTLLQLKAVLECEGREAIYECALCLYPPLYSEEEKLRRALQKEIEKADASSAQENVLRLPKEVDGKRIVWETPKSSAAGICLALTFLSAAGVWIGKNQELQKKEEERRRQLMLDYPDLLFKLSMLLNAGLTMQSAFFKIALEYRSRQNAEVHYAYEEMLTAYYEMQSGVPETRAYEGFGRRCGLNSYNKLGTMLSSNLQKGSEGLAKLLQEEAESSMEERRRMARKLGEEAGTKLLLPMVLMLLVVLVILMVPAMLAF